MDESLQRPWKEAMRSEIFIKVIYFVSFLLNRASTIQDFPFLLLWYAKKTWPFILYISELILTPQSLGNRFFLSSQIVVSQSLLIYGSSFWVTLLPLLSKCSVFSVLVPTPIFLHSKMEVCLLLNIYGVA